MVRAKLPQSNLMAMMVCFSAATAGVQPLKYGAKELDRENGLDLYDSPPQIITPEEVDLMWNLIPEKK